VLGVDGLNCFLCAGDVIAISDIMGECNRCKAKLRMSHVKRSVTVTFRVEETDGRSHNVVARHNMVSKITEGEDGNSIEEKMLSASDIRFSLDEGNVVCEVDK